MSFDFVMDAFPAYTKFDKTHKCLCALQVIGGEQGEAAADDSGVCPDVRPEDGYPVEEVIVGYKADLWPAETVGSILGLDAEASQDDVEALLGRMGRNLDASMSALDIDFSGTVVSGINAGENIESDGYYVPVALKTTAAIQDIDNEGNPVVDPKTGKVVNDMGIATATGYKVFLYSVDQNKPVQSIKVGDFYYAFDFSDVNFA